MTSLFSDEKKGRVKKVLRVHIFIALFFVASLLNAADVSIELIADADPLLVPAGEQFDYLGVLTNLLDVAQTVDAWIMVITP
jgi:hypothetical protein